MIVYVPEQIELEFSLKHIKIIEGDPGCAFDLIWSIEGRGV